MPVGASNMVIENKKKRYAQNEQSKHEIDMCNMFKVKSKVIRVLA